MNKRKPMNDALAQEFVFGDNFTSLTTTEAKDPALETPAESLISRLLEQSPKEATIRLTVDMPESMHRKLSLLSARTGKKKAVIVRLLLEEALVNVKE
jgi:hypothetical protein